MMIDILFKKYLFEAKKQQTPEDAKKAVEQLASQLAKSILSMDDEFHEKGGNLDNYIKQATSKAQSVLSRLHQDSRVISHFLESYHSVMGKSVNNEIPGAVSSLIKSKIKSSSSATSKTSIEPKNKKNANIDTETTKEKTKKNVKDDEEAQKERKKRKEEIRKENHPGQNIIVRDKSLSNVNTIKSKIWTEIESIGSDDEWENKNKNNLQKEKFVTPSWLKYNQKVPQKYFKVIERMVNSINNKITSKISHFIPGAGAGKIESQAGEIVMMISSTMTDNEWSQYKKHLLDAVEKTTNGIITKEWIIAADNNRKALYKRLKRQYKGINIPDDIIAGCWDTKEEVEGLGLKDYKKNKGFSTDVYFKIKYNGKEFLVEQSLKKDGNANLSNSGTGKFSQWDKNIPDDIKLSVYAENQKNKLSSFVTKHKMIIDKMLKDMKNFDPDNKTYKEILSKMEDGGIESIIDGSNRDKRKAMNLIIKLLSDKNFNEATKMLEELKSDEITYSKNCIYAINNNPKLKEGMLEDIRSSLPLKEVSVGEEAMSIGDLSLDIKTFKELFGTNDWDKIKEKITVKMVKNKPIIVYSGSTKDEDVPIANLVIREDGVGYGGVVKFELQIHKEFIKKLKEVDSSLINKLINNSMKKYVEKYLFEYK